jgi:glycosyltransferase involved in cell wall biosynthesis
MAYASSAVPTTLADAGILFHQKNWAVLAELIDRVVKDEALRAQLIAQGRQRAAEFAAETVAAQWQAIIQTLLEKR